MLHEDDWFTLEEWTQRLGALTWIEQQLSEILGLWSASEADPGVAITWSSVGRHHSWHSEVLASCLPTSPQLRDEDLIAAPTGGWQRAVETLRTLQEPFATSLRLRCVVKVVHPWLTRETETLMALARPVSDAAIMRWLRFVELDHHDDHKTVEMLFAANQSAAVSFDDHRIINGLNLLEDAVQQPPDSQH